MSNTEVAPQEILCETEGTCAGVELWSRGRCRWAARARWTCAGPCRSAQRTLDRRLVLRRPLRPGRGRRVRRDGASPPHPHTGLQTVSWLFTGEIEHRDSAGHPRDGPARRAQPDDRRPRHLPLGGLHPGHDRPARRAAVGGAARRGTATSPRRSSTTRPSRSPATAGRPGCSSARCSASTSPVATYTPCSGAELLAGAGTR